MTCIVGIEHEGAVFIGGDSLGSNGFTGDSYDRPKVFKNDSVIFGVCGSFRLLQTLEFEFTVPKMHIGEKLDDYVYKRLFKSLYDCLKSEDCIAVKDSIPKVIDGSSFLFAVKEKLFCFQSDLAILRTKSGYNATGAGMYHAISSLFSTADSKKSPEERIRLAIQCADNFVVSVNSDITIVDNKDEVLKGDK